MPSHNSHHIIVTDQCYSKEIETNSGCKYTYVSHFFFKIVKYQNEIQLDIVNSADSAFFILKLVSLVNLDPHCIFIPVAF